MPRRDRSWPVAGSSNRAVDPDSTFQSKGKLFGQIILEDAVQVYPDFLVRRCLSTPPLFLGPYSTYAL